MTTTATTTQVSTGTYTLDPVHSTFGFAVRHNGVSTFRGLFEDVDARLEGGVLTGTARVESVKVAIDDLKAHLLSPEFFNAAEAPTVEFRSTEIRGEDDGRAEVDGELEIRGVVKPITATGTFHTGIGISGSEVVGLDLTAALDRRDFGLNWQAELPSGGDTLAWDVTLEVHLELAAAA
jgi:polyisoprenoid-binding protein YceI